MGIKRLTGNPGGEVVGCVALSQGLSQLQRERPLSRAGPGFCGERVAAGGVEEFHNLAWNATGGWRHGTASKQRGRIYIGFRADVIRDRRPKSPPNHGAPTAIEVRRRASRAC